MFTRIVNTSATLMWDLGRKTRMRMTARAPKTCHQTETLFITAMRWPLKMLTTATRMRMTRNIQNTRARE